MLSWAHLSSVSSRAPRGPCGPCSPRWASSVLYSDSASGPGTGEAGASVGPEPGRDGHTVSYRPQSSRQWHGQQVNTMADEDTDWSYSETIPKPQISTLSKTILLLNWRILCHPCTALDWLQIALLRAFKSQHKWLLYKVLCTRICCTIDLKSNLSKRQKC